jgi:hypothetical protein
MNAPTALDEPNCPAPTVLACCALAILAAAISLFAWGVRDCFVDDAFIGFQYIDNLRAGQGFVFQVGQKPVEGVTNIGWLMTVLPLAAVIGSATAAKTLGWLLLLVALAATIALGGKVAGTLRVPSAGDEQRHTECACYVGGFGLTLVPAMLLASSFEFLYFPLAGMETALLAALLLAMAWVALRTPASLMLPLIGALAFLVHPEAAAVYPLYAALAWARSRVGRAQRGPPETNRMPLGGPRSARPTLLTGSIVFVILIGAITAARFAYFGDVVPNTFYSKPGGVRLALQNGYAFLMGRNTNVAFPVTGWLAIPVLWLGYRRLRRARAAAADMLAAIAGTGLLFAVYSPPDWTALPRYFAPYLPAALMLLWAGVLEAATLAHSETVNGTVPFSLTRKLGQSRRCPLAAVALVLLLTNLIDARAKMACIDEFPGYVLAGKSLVAPAQWMDEHLPARATIAARRIGALAYYSHHNVFDFAYGLPDVEVAHQVARHAGRFDTPLEPMLASLWQSRAPDYLLEDNQIMDYIISLSGGVRERFVIHGIEYRVVREFPIGRETTWVLAQRR